MKNFLTIILIQFTAVLLLGVKLYGENIDIDKLQQDTNNVIEKVDKAYDIIQNSSTQKSVYSVLDRYPNSNEAKLASSWFRMATQLTSNRQIAFFIVNSSYKVKAQLSKLGLDRKHPLSSKDRDFIFSKIDYLVKRTATDRPVKLDTIYSSTKNLFIRSMPIVNKLTKKKKENKFVVLKKGEKFKLLYKTEYKNRKGYILRWGFIETLKNAKQGWINLNKLHIK